MEGSKSREGTPDVLDVRLRRAWVPGRIAEAAWGPVVEPREGLARAAPPQSVAVPPQVREPPHLVWLAIIQMELRVSPRSFCPQRRHFPCRWPWPNKLNSLSDFLEFPRPHLRSVER